MGYLRPAPGRLEGWELVLGCPVCGTCMSDPTDRKLHFDVFELDIRAGELRKRGVKLRLQGQPLQVLGILLKRAGELVTRDELRAEIWPADTFVDFDHSLHNAIARIRQTLGDSAETPRYIETLPRRGYRFMEPVEWRGWRGLGLLTLPFHIPTMGGPQCPRANQPLSR